MKFKSQIFTQVSGSIGGTTFSRNKGGLYIRARAIPTNPNTPSQVNARDALSTAVDAWTNILTQAQRDDWGVYATNTPVVDVFGDPKTLSGQQMYIRSNTPRIRNGDTRVDDAPIIFDLGTFTTPTIAISVAAPNDIVVTFTDTDEWANNTGAFLYGSASRQQNASVNFFKAPFRSAGSIAGLDATVSPPQTLVSDFNYAEGNKVFVNFRASQVDGRLSNNQIVETIVTA